MYLYKYREEQYKNNMLFRFKHKNYKVRFRKRSFWIKITMFGPITCDGQKNKIKKNKNKISLLIRGQYRNRNPRLANASSVYDQSNPPQPFPTSHFSCSFVLLQCSGAARSDTRRVPTASNCMLYNCGDVRH